MEKKAFRIPHRVLALVLALILVVGIVFMIPSRAANTSALGQLIDYFKANSSTFALTTSSRFFLATETAPSEEVAQTVQLAQSQFASDGIPSSNVLDIVYGKTSMVRAGDILIVMDPSNSTIGDEGYILNVSSYATVTAKDVRGLLYGLNMLQKHFRNAKTNVINGFDAYDTPDTKERTVQLDCARKYLTVEYVCNFIKEMSWMGYNSLQLHVSEDGGFRADFWDKEYYVPGSYEPVNDFTWLCGSYIQSWVKDETSSTGKNYRDDIDAGKFLSTKDLLQIIDTCKTYHIDIIPSFDSPAHMDYLTWKFEQNYKSNNKYSFTYKGVEYQASATSGCINYTGTTGYASPDGPYTTMDIRDTTRGKMSQAFVFSIYEDMAAFFKYYAGSTKFNIGADEVNLNRSGSWTYDLFPGYINEVNSILKGYGYTCRMFNDFINDNNVSAFDSDIEILYWNSPYNSIDGKAGYYSEPSVSSFVNNGRTLYNCINQHTYYVLRIYPGGAYDARSSTCYKWEFYGSTETAIYNDWAPNNIRKKGKYTEPDAIVPTAQLGGAYFLTWNDYAAVSTETDIWNGVTDPSTRKTGEVYSLRERMWSNSIKMWNWDINNTNTGGINFATYETLRDTLGDFPGLQKDTYAASNYAKATSLPASTEPIALADHTQLTAALADKKLPGNYSQKTYDAYLAAYEAAVSVNANNRATAAELGTALDNLNKAIQGLKEKTNAFTVVRKTTVNNVDYVIDSTQYEIAVSSQQLNMPVPGLNGYKFLRVEGATFTPNSSGDDSGYLTGTVVSDMVITMWYENMADDSRLNDLLAEAITEQGNFTYNSWLAYSNAVKNAKNFAMTATTRQDEIDKLVKALEDTRTALVTSSDTTQIVVEKLSGSFIAGEQVGLYIKTSSNIPSLTITNKATGEEIVLDSISGEVQTLNTGETVKYWVVFFTVEEAGTYTYTVNYRLTSADVTVTVA